jgi:hypothetical protein
VLAPGLAAMRDQRPCKDEADDRAVKDERTNEVATEMIVRGAVVEAEIGGGCDGLSYLPSSGRVTMLILVIPARFTASITDAKAPKGTCSSARR